MENLPKTITPKNFGEIQNRLNKEAWILNYGPISQRDYEILLVTNPTLSNNGGYYIETSDPKHIGNRIYSLMKNPIEDILLNPAVTSPNNLKIGDYIFYTPSNIYLWKRKLYFDDCSRTIYIPHPHQQIRDVLKKELRKIINEISKYESKHNHNPDFGDGPIEKIIEHIMKDLEIKTEVNNIEAQLVFTGVI